MCILFLKYLTLLIFHQSEDINTFIVFNSMFASQYLTRSFIRLLLFHDCYPYVLFYLLDRKPLFRIYFQDTNYQILSLSRDVTVNMNLSSGH